MRGFFLLIVLALVAAPAHADRVVVRNSPGAVVTSAQADADTMASTGRLRHSGRAGCREGIGCGSTPEAALSNSPGAVVTSAWADAGRLQMRGTYRVQLLPAGRKIASQRIW